MSKFRTELENLFLKILEEPDTKRANDNTLRILVEYAKIPPEPVSILDNMPLSDSMLRSFALMTELLSPKKPFPDIRSIHIDDAIAESILELNADLTDKFVIVRDSEGKAIGLQIK